VGGHPEGGGVVLRALRGEILSFDDDPSRSARALRHWPDGVVVVEAGKVKAVGPATDLLPTLASGATVDDWSGRLILPGFVDAHVHYSQIDIIASEAGALLPWLERHTFPAEAAFADPNVGRETAAFFLDELLRAGTTSALVFATVHPASVDALFETAEARHMRIAAGKVLMDRNCPENLRDSAHSGYEDSLALLQRWHGKGRLRYAVTPRFAVSSSDAQLKAAARLYREHDGVLMQTHVAENREEIEWVRRLFPDDASYVAVYERFGLLGPRAVLAHGVHLDDGERALLAASGAAVAFCPSSNLFLGSGLFDYDKARAARVPVALATDVGAGTSLSMLRTMQDAYKVCRLAGHRFSALDGFYLATLGGARALGFESLIGAIAAGREADLVVLDPLAIPLLARRTARARSLEERLFALMMLGDERCVAATYVLGEPATPRSASRTSGRRGTGRPGSRPP
jgi:guanine deaminase